jgi:hypothetical protein
LATEAPEYQGMRAARPDGRTIPATNLTLQRDVVRFDFRSGVFHLLAPAIGQTFGAVFIGDGSYELTPATNGERKHLALVTGDKDLQSLRDSFDTMVLLFADGTADEILKHAAVREGTPDSKATAAYEEHLKQQKRKYQINLHLRVLRDLLNGTAGAQGVFIAAVDGKRLDPGIIAVDPSGIGNLAAGFGFLGGEETTFLSFDEENGGFWYLSGMKATAVEGRGKPLRAAADAEHYTIDTTIKSNSEIEGTATIRFKAVSDLRVLPLHIMAKLRIAEALRGGMPLAFVQEEIELGRWARLFNDEVADADAAVVFPEPIRAGETVEIRVRYGGREVLRQVGADSYSVRARESWYPNTGTFTDTATYDMTFRFPKKNKLISVGTLVSENEQGGQRIANWKSGEPIRVAGFNYGRFDKTTRRDEATGMDIDVYSHPDFRKMAGDTMVDAQNAARVGDAFFGKAPHAHVSVTQVTDFGTGQSWPSLVYLPILALMTSTDRVEAFEGVDPRTMSNVNEFAKTVGWHEIAHQWWGHLVGWESYRDQWLSEGFAEFTAAVVLQATEGNRKYADYWNRRRQDIFSRGPSPIVNNDAGAISQGFRLATKRTPAAGTAVLYDKGGYVLHMLRMMMREGSNEPDAKFIAMMKDFVTQYSGKSPSTADFQRVVEKHMNPRMDAAGNRKMDWFFNQWIHGTQVPRVRSTMKIAPAGGGKYRITGEVIQDGVSPDYITVMPIYVDFGGDKIARLGVTRLIGNSSQDMTGEVALPMAPKRVTINYMNDVLTRD